MLVYRIEDDTGEGPFIKTKPELKQNSLSLHYYYGCKTLQGLYNYLCIFTIFLNLNDYMLCIYETDYVINYNDYECLFYKDKSVLLDKRIFDIKDCLPKPIVQNLYTDRDTLNYSLESFIKMLGVD